MYAQSALGSRLSHSTMRPDSRSMSMHKLVLSFCFAEIAFLRYPRDVLQRIANAT